MKIAFVHDYLKEYGGAELVLETLSDLFPDAPIYTTLCRPDFFGPHRSRLEAKWSHRVRQSFFQYIPFAHKLISPLRLLSPLAFKSFDFSGFDILISSATGAYFPNSVTKKQAKLICYCHTPPRYLYGLPTARNFTQNPLIALIVKPVNYLLRLADKKFSQNVDQYLANSSTTASRIKKFYGRDALIINPPVTIPSKVSKLQSSKAPFYLTGSRLARAKRYDIAIQACNQLKLPLKVFGRDFAGFEAELKSIAGPTIEFLGEVTQAEKSKLFTTARAFIYPSDNEDFGIVAVEAQARGCPVIGYNSGGVTETVVDGQTGVLFDELTPESCVQAIQKFEKLKIDPQNCLKNARRFSPEVFIQKIKAIISRS